MYFFYDLGTDLIFLGLMLLFFILFCGIIVLWEEITQMLSRAKGALSDYTSRMPRALAGLQVRSQFLHHHLPHKHA